MIILVIGPERSGKYEAARLMWRGLAAQSEALMVDAIDPQAIYYRDAQWKSKNWERPLNISQDRALELFEEANIERPLVWVASPDGFYPPEYMQIIRCETIWSRT